MKRFTNIVCTAIFAAALAGPGLAQEQKPDRVVVPLTNPAKPATVEAEVMRGNITVKGYEGKEIIVEALVREKVLSKDGRWDEFEHFSTQKALKELATAYKDMEAAGKDSEKALEDEPDPDRENKAEQEKEKKDKAAGLKLISSAKSGLEVRENNNVVAIETQTWKNAVDLTIQVPYSTSVKISSGMTGDIVVSGVSGEIEIESINGDVNLANVSGAVVANTMNGNLTATMNRAAPDKPMAFSTMKGDVDVTLPADLKATVKMKSDQGEVYSDFDIVISPGTHKVDETPEPDERHGRRSTGKFHVSFEKFINGAIGGGGPEISFSTFSGDIYIRKKK